MQEAHDCVQINTQGNMCAHTRPVVRAHFPGARNAVWQVEMCGREGKGEMGCVDGGAACCWTKRSYLGVELEDSCHVPEQRLWLRMTSTMAISALLTVAARSFSRAARARGPQEREHEHTSLFCGAEGKGCWTVLTWECAELILLDVDNRDEACPGEMERVLVQAVQVALLDVAGGT